MTTLRFEKKKMMGYPLGKDSLFPAMRDPIKSTITANLDEDDNLFINHGMYSDSLPYTMQDDYDHMEKQELEFDSAVLENKHLKAVFVLSLGGRLWSLYDKDNKRDLIIDNPEFLPCNLAVRNAWFAGGAEYNIGRRGHDAQTCSPRFVAKLKDDDGTPVLRIYEMSRDRLTPFQLDFFLPEKSKFLYLRGRIINVNKEVVPMYWWSNIATKEEGRVIVPTMETYANMYDGGNHSISKLSLPYGEGFDCTYPKNFTYVKDHFYNISNGTRKYECQFFNDGYGFAHASTRRLQGRKLFVWGMSQGGRHWQRKLVPDGIPDYIELQAGICKTQQECMPMPPETTWEWLEAYGAITMKPDEVFGEWEEATTNVTRKMDELIPETQLNEILERTKKSFATKSGEKVLDGSSWGALEELRRGEKLVEYLDFGNVSDFQKEWCDLLESGRMDDSMPKAFAVQKEWHELLKKSRKTWKTLYHLAINYFREKDYERALTSINESIALNQNAWNIHAKSNILRVLNKLDEAAELLIKAALLEQNDSYLIKEAFKVLRTMDKFEDMIFLFSKLDCEMQKRPMIQFLYADALAHCGNILEAEKIIMSDGGIELMDLREGEISISDLYIYIQQQKAKAKGIELSAESVNVPFKLDVRMIL